MKIVFLGTSCMVPTKERNHQSLLLVHKGEGLLFDCGEGTQRQLKLANVKPSSITKIFISHWHGDHVLGLPGLLQTMNASEYDKEVEIYGPVGTKNKFKGIFETFAITNTVPIKINEIVDKQKIEFRDLIVTSRELDHTVRCLGFSIKEKDRRRIKISYVKKLGIPDGPLLGKLQNNKKINWNKTVITPEEATYIVKGKKIAIILDTLPCYAANELSKNADILISEAVYTDDLTDKAHEYKHLTATQAAQIASQNNVEKLILTHFSQRYKTIEKIVDEARVVFQNTLAAHDLMRIKV